MSIKKRGLGRGLEALLGGTPPPAVADRALSLGVEQLRPGRFQPRKDMDPAKLRELADSISAQGVVQPVVVRPISDDSYEIIAGERRWRAAQLAGLAELPVVVREVSDQSALAIALIENIQREDLNPLEEAEALKRLLNEYSLTHQQLADAVGKSRVSVTNLLRLNELHPDVKSLLLRGAIEMGHARALLGVSGDEQAKLARLVADRKLTVRATEQLMQQRSQGKTPVPVAPKDPDIRNLEQNLAETIGAEVVIRHGRKGSGQLIIHYDSLDQLEGVLGRLR